MRNCIFWRNSKSKRGNNSNKMLDGVVFSCQQIGVNTFYKCIEFQVNSFDSYWEISIILKNIPNFYVLQILDCISLQYARNERKTNKCFTWMIRKTHDTNARYTNNWSVHVTIYYPMINDPVSTEVQYSIVLLFEWLLCKLTWLTNLIFYMQLIQNGYINDKLVSRVIG